jgi:hypothetical protein
VQNTLKSPQLCALGENWNKAQLIQAGRTVDASIRTANILANKSLNVAGFGKAGVRSGTVFQLIWNTALTIFKGTYASQWQRSIKNVPKGSTFSKCQRAAATGQLPLPLVIGVGALALIGMGIVAYRFMKSNEDELEERLKDLLEHQDKVDEFWSAIGV